MGNGDLEISIIIFRESRTFKNINKIIVEENEESFGNFQTILFFEIKSWTLINYVGPRTCWICSHYCVHANVHIVPKLKMTSNIFLHMLKAWFKANIEANKKWTKQLEKIVDNV